MSKLLTKSKFLNGLDSDAFLWRVVNQPETIPSPDAFSQQCFEDGIDLASLAFLDNIRQTKIALTARKPIFEAGFLSVRFYVRVDILVPVGNDEWDIIEVKSSTKPKEIHIHDLAFQRFVIEQCRLKIRNTTVMLVNNQYVRQGELSVKDLFYFENVSEQVSKFILKIPVLAQRMLNIIDQPECPEFNIEELVKGDYSNVFKDEFMANLPKGSVFELYKGRKKQMIDLWLSGIQLIKDLPIDEQTREIHLKQREAAISGKPYINPDQIRSFVEGLEYPIYHLDFETFNPAIPPYDGTRPYMQIPFQYSLHIEYSDGTIEHREYLHSTPTDPRKALFEQMNRDIGNMGTILAFYQTFEKGRIKEWAQATPEYLNWAERLTERMQDLLTPFKQFYYYHPDQRGSCSIKKVLPVMSDLSYKGMTISNGGEALSAYIRYFVNNKPHDNKEQLIKDMLAYCELDTWAMVLILRQLRELIK
jgi:hypothetical protein